VEVKIRESDLTRIIAGTDGARISRSVILTVNMKTVQMLSTLGEQDLKNTAQECKIEIARDEQSSPDQRTDITKNNTKLVSKGWLGISIHPGSLQSRDLSAK
jgi:hypothetical protein